MTADKSKCCKIVQPYDVLLSISLQTTNNILVSGNKKQMTFSLDDLKTSLSQTSSAVLPTEECKNALDLLLNTQLQGAAKEQYFKDIFEEHRQNITAMSTYYFVYFTDFLK